jgi:endonuclease/exonuclease/phosphatase family metal-dependent hydrolase
MLRAARPALILTLAGLFFLECAAAETFRVGTYNLENYVEPDTTARLPKPAEARAKIRESILAMKPDVLALQEMGGSGALLELRESLKMGGLDFLHWELVHGFDTNIHVAVLSRFPLVARHPHTNDGFLLGGRRFQVSRGFAEVEVQVNAKYKFTLITAHLKSRRPIAQADEAEMREQEAIVLREKIDADFKSNPELNLVVLGDFNDTKDSRTVRAIVGRGRTKLLDTRPGERNGDTARAGGEKTDQRQVTWTHFYAKEDTYSRIDYLMVSPGMAREWLPEETFIVTVPNWGVGSDHRPLVATFVAVDK